MMGRPRPSTVKKPLLSALIGLTLVLSGCGTADPSADPGAGSDPDAPVDSGVSTHNTSGEDPVDAGDGSGSTGTLLRDTVGDSPLHIDEVEVRVAESFPVQLFLHVVGNAPTPCHQVAYSIDTDAEGIAVQLTTVAGDGMCAQVLEPVDVSVPLGRADLPVTVTVNDGEFVTTVDN